MEEAGKWKLAELSDEYYPLPKGEPDVIHGGMRIRSVRGCSVSTKKIPVLFPGTIRS
jgi:hypothetical protein